MADAQKKTPDDGSSNVQKQAIDIHAAELGKLEDMVRTHSVRRRTELAVLGTLSVVGLLAVGALAPNVAGLLAKAVPDMRPTSQRQSVKRAIGRLIEQGYIKKEGNRYQLTREGTQQLEDIRAHALAQSHTSRAQQWDGKWRIVIFDIKEDRRSTRDSLRTLLVETGFVKLQNSVWVYPFRCDEVIALLKFHLTLGWDLIYIIADAIEGDEDLRKYYSLPA